MEKTKEKITLASKKDFEVSYFCGSGPGGQARNKVASGVQIIHKESGAIGRASDSRSQAENKKAAFERLVASPKMKHWLAGKLYEIQQQETLEESVEKDMAPSNLKYEIKDEEGKWIEVTEEYFKSLKND
jgi:protein subunit release factor B